MRKNGMLLPISALPSNYGIGCFSKEAYEFVDLLKRAGQSLWQILPLGPTGYGDSPYQSFSTFAGNPYYIDLEQLIEEKLLTKEECDETDFGEDEVRVDYEKIYFNRFPLLMKAFEKALRRGCLEEEAYLEFCREQSYWLDDYALYMAVKESFEGDGWDKWEDAIRLREPDAVRQYLEKYKQQIQFYQYLQYLFSNQWQKLKNYANQNGVQIIGDIPIYVAFDSADAWSHPELFLFDDHLNPIAVAGCPPDGFAATGQLWGNPLYRWEYHKETGYRWWRERIAHCQKLFDTTRIDHFRGFDEYYAIPYGNLTAENGTWMPGPGIDFFHSLKAQMTELSIIAEDLGFLTDRVRDMLKKSGFPGMKVLQFAFDSREESDYLPHNYDSNCVVYTGTHDNDTLRGWYETLNKDDKKLAVTYVNSFGKCAKEIQWSFIFLAMGSVAKTCIIPVQDFLYLGTEARMNTPSTLGSNWEWRMKKNMFSERLIDRIRLYTKTYGRLR